MYTCSARYGCFYSSLILCFTGMLLWYYLHEFQMVLVAPIITVITFAFTFHMGWVSIMSSLYFKFFSSSFFIIFLSPGIPTYIDMHVCCLLSRIMMSGLLLGIVLSVRTCCYDNMVTLPHDLFRLILVHGHTSVCCVLLPLFPWTC